MPSGALLAMAAAADERRSGESGGACGEDDSGIGTHPSSTPSELAIISTGQHASANAIQQQQQQREFVSVKIGILEIK
jgi:hypothetical protein